MTGKHIFYGATLLVFVVLCLMFVDNMRLRGKQDHQAHLIPPLVITSTTSTTSYVQAGTTEVSTPHFLCVVYQAGGPNSARLWCDHGNEGATGAP